MVASADRKVSINVCLPLGVLEKLDAAAARAALSRSQFLREMLDDYLIDEGEAVEDPELLALAKARLAAGETPIPLDQARRELGL